MPLASDLVHGGVPGREQCAGAGQPVLQPGDEPWAGAGSPGQATRTDRVRIRGTGGLGGLGLCRAVPENPARQGRPRLLAGLPADTLRLGAASTCDRTPESIPHPWSPLLAGVARAALGLRLPSARGSLAEGREPSPAGALTSP